MTETKRAAVAAAATSSTGVAGDEGDASSTTTKAPRKSGSVITNYFLVILFGFGCMQLYLNTLTTSDQHHHQSDHIRAFQRKHFVKSNSASRKKYPVEGIDAGSGAAADIVVAAAADADADADPESADSQDEEDETNEENDEEDEDKDETDYRDLEGNEQHSLAGLSCERFGGPPDEVAAEMVYWEDVPSDSLFVSPFKKKDQKQYLTFEADHGGWNNIRMGMETVMTLAVAMGRTLVLPPEQPMYLLSKEKGHNGSQQRKHFSFAHFFHMESIAEEHVGLEVITMKEFLEREGITGGLRDKNTGEVLFPSGNKTDWDGESHGQIITHVEKYLHRVGVVPNWDPEVCLAAFPTTPHDVQSLQDVFDRMGGNFPSFEEFIDKPVAVDASPFDRMRENWADRKHLCIYDERLQNEKLLHFSEGGEGEEGARLLVHFYAFLFFQDWRQDLWMKRFVRDHVRYIDEIQCAAARVVHALRERSKAKGNEAGLYNAYHIRRGDFQYKVTRFDAPHIIKNSAKEMTSGGVVYIASDEMDRTFFEPFRAHFDIVFLDDFKDQLVGVNTNYYGMIDSLIASRADVFFGCWFSTFTGYINRLRGFHNNQKKGPGYEMGYHKSYYYALDDRKYHIQQYYPVKKSFYAREFPTAWRMIDKGIGELPQAGSDKQESS